MDGQAEDTGPESSLVQFLIDNPEADHQDDEQPSDEPQEDTSDESSDQPADDESDPEKAKDESGEKPEQTPGAIKLKIKGEDGEEVEGEYTPEQLQSMVMMRGDYTRKTMALAERERQAFETVTAKVDEFRGHYVKEAQTLRAVLDQAAGSRTPEEMAQLAHADPAAWAQERQRLDTLNSLIGRIDQSVQREQEQAKQLAQQQHQESQKRMAQVLQGEGFDLPKLQSVFKTAHESYGFTPEQLRNINDPALIRMMSDAAELRALKAKTPEVAKKAKEAPRLPPQRRPQAPSERVNTKLNDRFRTGKAGVKDLARWIATNS